MGSHTATGEWKSFEVRMRHRRAERLILRAEVAMEAGFIEDAEAALAEARRLCPSLPEIGALEARLALGKVSNVMPFEPVNRHDYRRVLYAVSITAVVSAATAVGIRYGATQWMASAAPSPSTAGTDINLPAEVITAAPPAPQDRIRIEQQAVPPVVLKATTAVPEPRISDEVDRIARAVIPPPEPLPLTVSPAAAPVTTPAAKPTVIDDTPAAVPVGALPEAPRPTAPVAALPPATMTSVGTAGATSPAPAPATTEISSIRTVLSRYADAYSALDANAAHEVWPTVDRGALSRAFSGLAAQKVVFNDCSIDIRLTVARATCHGTSSWEPRVGGSGVKTDGRQWAFDLRKTEDGWLIRDARVQSAPR